MTTRKPRRRRPLRGATVHAARVGVVVALVSLIPTSASDRRPSGTPPGLDEVRAAVRRLGWDVASIDDEQDTGGRWRLRDDDGQAIGYAATTLPEAADVVGYRGPTDALLILDPDESVVAVRLLSSGDTREHVEAVEADRAFLEQFVGWEWAIPAPPRRVDGVSGATLTSLAMAEGIVTRVTGASASTGSLVFPDPITRDEVMQAFPNAESFSGDPVADVFDLAGNRVGRLVRSGPFSDDRIGYQGPTELLIRLDETDRITSTRIRHSFDNEPYVDYVRQERSFWSRYNGVQPDGLSEMSPESIGIEGVSGATMTSLAVAETLASAGKEWDESTDDVPESWWSKATSGFARMAGPFAEIRWTAAEVATLAMVVAVLIPGRRRWLRHRFRTVWLGLVFAVIGLWTGNLVSMALVAGWSVEGIAWRLAPGLAAVAVLAVVAPPLSSGNPYCNHLCPHGAAQQGLRPKPGSRRHRRLPPRLASWLAMVPGVTLVIAYLTLLMVPRVDLSSWEPFHAYLFRFAGWGSIALAIGTLGVSAVVPMGYCRFGCPTGSLLEYLRRNARSDRFTVGDGVAVALLGIALAIT